MGLCVAAAITASSCIHTFSLYSHLFSRGCLCCSSERAGINIAGEGWESHYPNHLRMSLAVEFTPLLSSSSPQASQVPCLPPPLPRSLPTLQVL